MYVIPFLFECKLYCFYNSYNSKIKIILKEFIGNKSKIPTSNSPKNKDLETF